jgi:TP901 family phage tail tape measure protein
MALTMANTVRFGISSSIFNSLTGSISKAYNYSVDLDKSLNNIRIVSGQSADQMERFAKYANTAAKELGASTLDYTNASLIYYQQGLTDSEVTERTDVTVKMANALGASAEEVSQYMTAI